MFLYRNKPGAAMAFITALRVNQTLQIRHIGYRNLVAISSLIVQITADVNIGSDTKYDTFV